MASTSMSDGRPHRVQQRARVGPAHTRSMVASCKTLRVLAALTSVASVRSAAVGSPHAFYRPCNIRSQGLPFLYIAQTLLGSYRGCDRALSATRCPNLSRRNIGSTVLRIISLPRRQLYHPQVALIRCRVKLPAGGFSGSFSWFAWTHVRRGFLWAFLHAAPALSAILTTKATQP